MHNSTGLPSVGDMGDTQGTWFLQYLLGGTSCLETGKCPNHLIFSSGSYNDSMPADILGKHVCYIGIRDQNPLEKVLQKEGGKGSWQDSRSSLQ